MTQVFGGSRYSLTYEEWLDECVNDPSAYGYTKEQAIVIREQHYKGKENGTTQKAGQ